MEDPLIDGVLGKYLGHAYFSLRVNSLAVAIVATGFWIAMGWDSVVEEVILGPKVYGEGIHWSTLQTFFLLTYFLTVNMQVGGIKNLGQLKEQMVRDLISIGAEGLIVYELLRRRTAEAKEDFRSLRGSYDSYYSVDPVRGAAYALLIAFVATYAFEIPWVFLYDHFQFGSWMWPVYFDGASNPFLGLIFLRNVVFMAMALCVAGIMFYLVFDGEPPNITRRFSIKWRFNSTWVVLCGLAFASWVLWVGFPHQVIPINQLANSGSIYVRALTAAAANPSLFILPTQGPFPQTVYTFYNSTLYLKPYTDSAVMGFTVDNPWLHFVNVGCKYLTFGTVGYPAMIFVKRRTA